MDLLEVDGLAEVEDDVGPPIIIDIHVQTV
jgi:hypothetical protein